MADRKKVIKAIEICYTSGHNCTKCPLFPEDDCNDKLMRDALALLREQKAEIVRCKDCKHYDPDIQLCHNGLDGIFLPDWFCADGERR